MLKKTKRMFSSLTINNPAANEATARMSKDLQDDAGLYTILVRFAEASARSALLSRPDRHLEEHKPEDESVGLSGCER